MSRRSRFAVLLLVAAIAGAAVGLAVVASRDEPPPETPPRAPGPVAAVPRAVTLDPARAADTADWFLCRQFFRSALGYDGDGRLVAVEAREFSVRFGFRLAFRDGRTLSGSDLTRVLYERVLPHPDERLRPFLATDGERWGLWAEFRGLADGRFEFAAQSAPLGAAAAFAELLTPAVVDVDRCETVTQLRLVFEDAGAATRYAGRARELADSPLYARAAAAVAGVERPEPNVLLISTTAGAWLAAQPWTVPIVGKPATVLHVEPAGSYEAALDRYRRGEVQAATVLMEEAAPDGRSFGTGRMERRIIAVNVGRFPDAATREAICARRPPRSGAEFAVLAPPAYADLAHAVAADLGPFTRVEVRDDADDAFAAGRFDVFVGAIETGAGVDLARWFGAARGALGAAAHGPLLRKLDAELDARRRVEIERELFRLAEADHLVATLSRRPILFVTRIDP